MYHKYVKYAYIWKCSKSTTPLKYCLVLFFLYVYVSPSLCNYNTSYVKGESNYVCKYTWPIKPVLILRQVQRTQANEMISSLAYSFGVY